MKDKNFRPTVEDIYPWVCTDPDCDQWGRAFGRGVYQFRQGDFSEQIDINEFSEQDLNNEVASFYGSLADLKEVCGDDWEWIAAECIFENMIPM